MNRTILSLAIIKTHWDKNKADYIDNFIPLTANLLKENQYSEVDFNQFQKDFQERYGLHIPINALVTIFNRAKTKGLVYREHGKIYVKKENLPDHDLAIASKDIERKFNRLTDTIQKYAKDQLETDLHNTEIEEGLLSFLKEHDLDILFAAKDKSVLPDVKPKNKIKYVISKFSIHAYESNPQIFQFLLDVSIGHALSGAILYSEFNSFSGKLKDLNIYLDTPIILNLLGFNGEFKQQSVQELINILVEEKANVFILDTTRGEVDSILSDCHRWLEKGIYDLEKASRVLRYCHRNGISASDLEQTMVGLDRLLSDNQITSTRVPSYDEKEFVIDEEKLSDTIFKTYGSIIDNFDSVLAEQKGTIQRDVKVLSGIYRFRKGHNPKSIKDSKALFITSNTALAFASKRFESLQNGSSFTIPSCLTDVFLGTVIWLQSPQRVETINSKKFMAECYSAIQPSDKLIKKYLAEIEKLKSNNKISNDDYYLLRSHRVSINLLETKTMGDPDAIDASSTEEILDGIIQSIKEKEAKKLSDEIETHKQTKKKLETQEERVKTIETSLERKSLRVARLIWKILFGFTSLIVAFCLFANLFPDYFNIKGGMKVFLWVLIGLMTLLNLLTGFNFMGLKKVIIGKIQTRVLKWLKE
ncbi:hypothetical protein RQM65_03090 [Pricia sp. S334]|uniref:Uncharacterized protein n=1 Tax=Pricia mediterranea TaxID=3076079 RepID=A0ABU3L1P1_9FLAO|nr:hypothetical protein [Pricia sp. S334]MDT7827650.1 hypothetical protein [Pricia sp. S334]